MKDILLTAKNEILGEAKNNYRLFLESDGTINHCVGLFRGERTKDKTVKAGA